MTRSFQTAAAIGWTLSLIATVHAASDSSDLAKRASWSIPAVEEVRTTVNEWLRTVPHEDAVAERIEAIWQGHTEADGTMHLDCIVRTAAELDDRIGHLVTECQSPVRIGELKSHDVLNDESLPAWLRSNLRLYYARWLADQKLYDEARELLDPLSPADVADPASLLFYQGVASHRLIDKLNCLNAISTLLENESAIPRRYLTVARLMEADLKPLEPDSLDEVSRLMDNITVRLGHGRAGTRVRKEEDDVIAKLDKMIEKLEEQASAAAAAAQAGSSGGQQSAQPMQDSMPGGQTGPGNVNPKSLGAKTDWGNLPPKEREEALQELNRDLPSHFRDVIEEYFRKLAQDETED